MTCSSSDTLSNHQYRAIQHSRLGFTIVELLIVVVVIAILAAITIVSYNGITQRANASAASTSAEQAAKKVLVYMTTNGDQVPASLATAGINESGQTTYQYRTDTSASPQTFCVTATSSNISYFVNNTTQSSPKAGACPGHGADGIGTITNLATNPTGTGNSQNGWAVSNNTTLGYSATGGPTGGPYVSGTTTASTTLFVEHGITNSQVHIPVTAGQTYTFSVFGSVTTAVSQQFGILVRFYSATGAQLDFNTTNGYVTMTNGVWNRWSRTQTAPANSVKARVVLISNGSVSNGDVLRMTNVMVTSGSNLQTYADGSSTGWAWNGPANGATSTGPAL